jgi:UDP-N-acetylmuramoyl-L-alanyl-D-glutamate--2,6-diaminopimelate ligase
VTNSSRLRPEKTAPKSVAELVANFPLEVRSTAAGVGAEQAEGSAVVQDATDHNAQADHQAQVDTHSHASPQAQADLQAQQVTGIASDNREITQGEVFAALPGFTVHGATFAADAAKRGAAAILTDDDGHTISSDLGVPADVPVLVSPDVRKHFGPIAAHIYGAPAQQMQTFAVTGTNGKTTSVYLLQHILMALGLKAGLIGTVEMRSGLHQLPAKLTTPDAADLQAILATMFEDGVQALAMEVSSHALAMQRVHGVIYTVAGFTNLSQDHFDFHVTFDDYFNAKAELFTPKHAQRGVVVIDDEWGRKLAKAAQIPVSTLDTDFLNAQDRNKFDADWVVDNVVPSGGGSQFSLRHKDGREIKATTPLPGAFNVQNSALALAMVIESGVSISELQAALAKVGGLNPVVPGRMEVVSAGSATEPRVIVDFAHNTAAMTTALQSLARDGQGRVIVLFGAAGERDQGKRPAMGAAAVELADVVVLTDDDPHHEDPAQIRADVRVGAEAALAAASGQGRKVELVEIADRAEAIAHAIAVAQPGDTVLLAGRGHETIQQVGDEDILLDDRVEARAALAARQQGGHQSTAHQTTAHQAAGKTGSKTENKANHEGASH